MRLVTRTFLLVAIAVLIQGPPPAAAIASGANEPIADTELGLMARDCALQFCREKDALALWLAIVDVCHKARN